MILWKRFCHAIQQTTTKNAGHFADYFIGLLLRPDERDGASGGRPAHAAKMFFPQSGVGAFRRGDPFTGTPQPDQRAALYARHAAARRHGHRRPGLQLLRH